MYRKMGARRRGVFLRALAACGNVTLAAEKAAVSRSWVRNQRAAEPAFDAACAAALGEAEARLRAAEDGRPPQGWGFLDGMALAVRGSNRRRVQIARARAGQWTPQAENRFLAVLAATCNVKAACAAAGRSRSSLYAHRKRWPAFARRWDAAVEQGAVALEFAIVSHAANPFSARALPPPAEVPAMPVDAMFHALYMHKRQLTGSGGRPGRRGAPPDIEAVTDKVVRFAEVLKAKREIGAARLRRDARERARRGG